MSEAALIRRLVALLKGPPKPANAWEVGIGDDAAVFGLANGSALVVCCDQLVEDIDFRRRWASPQDIGHKAAAINLSDLAAMGAQPRALLASLAVPRRMPHRDTLALMQSMQRVGRRFGAPVIGGDLSAIDGPLVVSVCAMGQRIAPPLRRHRAQLGDLVVVGRRLGAAAQGLRELERSKDRPPRAQSARSTILRAQLRPMPQVALGQALCRARLVHSAADISDGLVRDVQLLLPPARHQTRALRATLIASRIPLARGVGDIALAATGGEDFALVMAMAPSAFGRAQRIAHTLGERLFVIGRIERNERPRAAAGVRWYDAPHLPTDGGFDHFVAKA